jgi:myo-inositol 2-dehydrogenase/D-chiro-inositol 1-dehydrogenase
MLQYTKSGILMDRINSQWYEQFKPTYALQLDQLVAASLKQGKVHATLIDGLKAQAVAEAAIQSISEKQPIIIQKVW